MLKVVIIGYGEMFTNLIAGTLDSGCEIVGVLRKDTVKYHPLWRKIKDIFNPSVEYNYIKSYSIPEINAKGVNTEAFKNTLLKLNPDIILVGSWGEKINKEIYDIPKIAAINAHPSLLPKYRGPNPYFWTIRNQETISGVTFHLIDKGFDTGAILAQEEIKIFPSDTGKTLKERTVLTARGVVCELLKALREDIIIPLTQSGDKASYYSHPNDLELNFNPYAVEILENTTDFKTAGTIIKSDYKKRIIEILCADNKILKMSVYLYKKYDRPFTRNYIKRELFEGAMI